MMSEPLARFLVCSLQSVRGPVCQRTSLQKDRSARGPVCKRTSLQEDQSAREPACKRTGLQGDRSARELVCKRTSLLETLSARERVCKRTSLQENQSAREPVCKRTSLQENQENQDRSARVYLHFIAQFWSVMTNESVVLVPGSVGSQCVQFVGKAIQSKVQELATHFY